MGRPLASSVLTATPERFLEAARDEFAAVGFAQAKLADIAARAGITRPSLLYHFGSKEELYRDGGAELLRPPGDRARRGDDDLRRLLRTAAATHARYSEFIAGDPDVARIVLRELLDGTGPGAEIVMHQIAPLVAQVERFVYAQGRAHLPPGVPVRAAIMQVATDVLVRAAAGPCAFRCGATANTRPALLEQLV